MISNNHQRLNIWLSLSNQLSYQSFVQACLKDGVTPLPIGEFAQKVGMISVALEEYPGLKPDEAYLKLIQEMNKDYTEKSSQSSPISKPESKAGCGGCNKQNQISDGGAMR